MYIGGGTTPAGLKPRVFILTDIGSDPDDQMSMTRVMVYSNELKIQGLVATTSKWLPNSVNPDLIQNIIKTYGTVRNNLVAHADGYPTTATLLSKVYSGYPAQGMLGVGAGKDSTASSTASNALVAAVEASNEPLWVPIWGGANCKSSHSADQLPAFVSKLRVYSISDQDDAGPWARDNFPSIFWIVSLNTVDNYNASTWCAISYDVDTGGPDASLVTNSWLDQHVRNVSPLEKVYPQIFYFMEGDTPSWMYLMQNGLNVAEHPNWGNWGDWYTPASSNGSIYSDTIDANVKGVNGPLYSTNHATLWRWRKAFQWDFAARMLWSDTSDRSKVNHNPIMIVNGTPSNHLAPLYMNVTADQTITLDASKSYDPDGNTITPTFWQYLDASSTPASYTPVLNYCQRIHP
ncbi:hypothetical protein M422DRAFT_177321 [Sphaerobolus stellatus SS14]|uniref:DUF1593-domain-containing protein n=1 Tax=Sphaerobolus stellatus (strain SS14) TaxID=990650 RepID=A0A0C9U4S6_SPHS4|nr:hypothetical protein M422DRAFT_177321 [Sphaerobolus stellatus SS14]